MSEIETRFDRFEKSIKDLATLVQKNLIDNTKSITTLNVEVGHIKEDVLKNCTSLKTHKETCNTRYFNCQNEQRKEDKLDKRAIIGWGILICISLSANVIGLLALFQG